MTSGGPLLAAATTPRPSDAIQNQFPGCPRSRQIAIDRGQRAQRYAVVQRSFGRSDTVGPGTVLVGASTLEGDSAKTHARATTSRLVGRLTPPVKDSSVAVS